MSEADPVRSADRKATPMAPPGSVAREDDRDRPAMVDADDFLGFTQRLHAARERVEQADVSREQRSRWQTRLIGITDGARTDLDRARAQLARFEGELERNLPG